MKTENNGLRGLLARVLLSLAAAALLMVPAAAAQAHDSLESSSPANGSTVSAMPAKIELTFDHTPIAINSIVRVEDATGADQADGPVEIVDNKASQAVKPGAPEGKYTVVWRVVSSDGHPIEGSFSFTAGGPNTAATSAPTAAPAATADAGLPGQLVVVGVVAAVLVIALVVAGFVIRNRLRNSEGES